MASPQERFQELIAVLHAFRIRELIFVSGATLFAYDVFLTFDREYKYIWKARWTLSKFIYLVFRYFALGWQLVLLGKYLHGVDTGVSLRYCTLVARTDSTQSVLVHQLAVLAITIRTGVLYQNQRSINLMLGAGYLLNFFGMLGPILAIVTRMNYRQGTLGLAMGCHALSVCEGCVIFAQLNWIPVEVFELVLCVMTIRRAMQQGQIFSTRLTTVLYRDGFTYFAVVFFCGTLQFVCINVFLDNGYQSLIVWSLIQSIFRAITSVTCCRMVLNLQGALTKPSQFELSIYPTEDRPNTSTMRFDSGPKATIDSTGMTSTYFQTASERDTVAQDNSAEEVELDTLSRQTPSRAQG